MTSGSLAGGPSRSWHNNGSLRQAKPGNGVYFPLEGDAQGVAAPIACVYALEPAPSSKTGGC